MNSVLPGNSIFSPNHYRAGFYSHILSIKVVSKVFFFFFGLIGGLANAQTDFSPGQIMFTGYDSDDPDAFSIVLLTDVVSGTDIYITDRGWSNTTGYRVDAIGEGTIKFSITEAYS